jgi:hypothetical protein
MIPFSAMSIALRCQRLRSSGERGSPTCPLEIAHLSFGGSVKVSINSLHSRYMFTTSDLCKRPSQ